MTTQHTNRRRFLIGAGCTLLGGGRLAGAAAQDASATAASGELLDEKTSAALKSGHKFLTGHQQDDGSFGTGGYRGNVAVCSLAGMALMSAGYPPGRGAHGKSVSKFLDYVLNAAQDSGFLSVSTAASHGPMYDHGFATLFLAECYGMSLRADLRDKLSKAVKLIVNSQNDEGGWRYRPQRDEADISVTVCQVMALRAARNAGIYVPVKTIEQAADYVKKCQNPDGGFLYRLPIGDSAFPRSAAGIVALNCAGIYDGPELKKAVDYVLGFKPSPDLPRRFMQNYYYGHYYAVQAMWQVGGATWRDWYRAIRDDLLTRQSDDGSWSDPYGREFATAMACLVLQMPNNYLPIFQR